MSSTQPQVERANLPLCFINSKIPKKEKGPPREKKKIIGIVGILELERKKGRRAEIHLK